MKNWISRICLGAAMLITVYNFFITEKPVESATGIVLLLLIIAIIPKTLKTE